MTESRKTTRVAALYDIHGNLPALEAVLDAIRTEGVDQVVVGGDVLPGPMPGECLAALHALAIPVQYIYGNGERDVLAFRRGEVPTRVPERNHDVMRWVARQLTPDQDTHLAAWPLTTALDVPGIGRVEFCHATPRDEYEIFTRLTPENRLRPIFEAAGAPLVICGHTHMQFDRMIGAVRVVNAGSVGMPFGGPGACWALLGQNGIELRCTAYDVDAAAARLRETGYPSELRVQRPPTEAEMLDVLEAAALK